MTPDPQRERAEREAKNWREKTLGHFLHGDGRPVSEEDDLTEDSLADLLLAFAQERERRIRKLPGLFRKLGHEAPNNSAQAGVEICADLLEQELAQLESAQPAKGRG